MRLKASTTSTTQIPGAARYHHAPAEMAPLEKASSRIVPGHRGRIAKAEEGQRRLGQDGDRHGQRRIRQHQWHDVGQHVPRHLVQVARAEGLGPLQVGPALDGECLGPDQPGGGGPRGHPDHDDDVEQALAENGGQDDGQRQEGDDEEPVGEPVQDSGDQSAVVP